MRPPFFFVIASLLALVLLFSVQTLNADTSLPASDRVAIQKVLEQFRTGWLAGNAEAVQNTFTENAVLMPHHGVPPVVGMSAIKEFWWPASSPKTTITRFTQTLDEIGGEGHIAFVRGRSEVSWTIEDQKKGVEKWRTGGNFMALLHKQPNGKWLMSHLIWDDPPNQRIN
jgi:uncharacterized protein (TIGR02246 family)